MLATFVSSKHLITSIIICADNALFLDNLVRGDKPPHFNSSNGDIVFALLLALISSAEVLRGDAFGDIYDGSVLLLARDLDIFL